MADLTVKTDIIIAIHPEHVLNIASRAKDHEFRNYLIASSVQRIWIYETSPASAVKYVARISAGKRPGEISNPLGLLNTEFNQGKLESDAKYAYEILDLQALPDPWTLNSLKERGWLKGPPQKYCYVKESMVAAFRDVAMTKVFDAPTTTGAGVIEAGSSSTTTSDGMSKSSENAATSQELSGQSIRKSAIPAKLIPKPIGIIKKPSGTAKATTQQAALMEKWLRVPGSKQNQKVT